MHQTPPDMQAKELSFFDESNPRSLVNLLPDAVAQQVRLLYKSDDADLLGMSEYDLFRACRDRGRQPQAIDNVLRVKFWTEYDAVQGSGAAKMNMSYVIGRLISREAFYRFYLPDHKRLAWMLCPATDYRELMEEALAFGVMRLRNFFEETDFSSSAMSQRGLDRFLMAFRLLDERVNGARLLPGKKPGSQGTMVGQGTVSGEERTEVDRVIVDSLDKEIKEREERIAKLREKVAKGNV